MGVKPEIKATPTPTIMVIIWGVPYRGWILQALDEIRPSRDMAKNALVWAYIMTSKTVDNPQMAPVPTKAEPKL
ncbi:hypothetical protein SDC9_202139 [bioreactor metagenome]|uniref:Uncharacterized protein n=1 Tax=bioreactor metagenome TaxID=1076179 RepID=A0A645IVL9_9ZZZZ